MKFIFKRIPEKAVSQFIFEVEDREVEKLGKEGKWFSSHDYSKTDVDLALGNLSSLQAFKYKLNSI